MSHSDDSITWLVDKKFPELDVVVVRNEALKVRMWLKDHLDRFYIDVPMHNQHGDVIKGQSKKELALCGDGSIFKLVARERTSCKACLKRKREL